MRRFLPFRDNPTHLQDILEAITNIEVFLTGMILTPVSKSARPVRTCEHWIRDKEKRWAAAGIPHPCLRMLFNRKPLRRAARPSLWRDTGKWSNQPLC